MDVEEEHVVFMVRWSLEQVQLIRVVIAHLDLSKHLHDISLRARRALTAIILIIQESSM